MYQLRIVFTLLLTLFLVQGAWSQTNYCQANLCSNGAQHIGCNNFGAYGSVCSLNARIIPLNPILRRNIVRVHNALRNIIASGSITRYQPAVRMASMVWNPELARLATMSARRCVLRPDQCRNTLVFRFAGQNSGRTTWVGLLGPTVRQLAIRTIRAWFRENRLCNAQQITNLSAAIVNRCGHFTAMIQEKNNAIGCAVLRETRNFRNMQYLVCNYAFNNVLNQQPYRVGTRASSCTTGTNPQFSGLCSIREAYTLGTTQF